MSAMGGGGGNLRCSAASNDFLKLQPRSITADQRRHQSSLLVDARPCSYRIARES